MIPVKKMMKSDNSKEEILKKVRQALGKGDYILEIPELASTVLKPFKDEDSAILFAENFLKTKGVFFFCENTLDLYSNLKSYLSQNELTKIYSWEKKLVELLQAGNIKLQTNDENFIEAEVGITLCEALVTRTGSIIVSSGTDAGRRLGIFPHIHIVIGYTSQIVKEVADGLSVIRKKYHNKIPSMVSVVTGPSRTADIEKTLVLGAHGPKELVLFLIDDHSQS